MTHFIDHALKSVLEISLGKLKKFPVILSENLFPLGVPYYSFILEKKVILSVYGWKASLIVAFVLCIAFLP